MKSPSQFPARGSTSSDLQAAVADRRLHFFGQISVWDKWIGLSG